ncbi:5-carboxymethyl-2-hydroxymuconate Delta-isomerase [Thiomicrorhabdus lithotrophica]|uniref:5-carboxymethyl-2-hydroxymuconate isomerase n=1 Tax=Thiomicrorhabdus lithotrophica TaxID=2949997 RepID=A0ABY8CHL4_9GAMM|nr:hypothetical protein [Thiomicrorhabdus lithotrophica]WEJ63648.1 hypothetical protein NR989_05170 [Thiomicrorhabdus lithotrophica]
MPHIVIEYSQDSFKSKDFKGLPSAHKELGLKQGIPGLVNSVFEAVANTDIVNPENIKVRAYQAEFYKLGLANTGFMHAVCKTHRGKTEFQKQKLSQAILNALEQIVLLTAEHSMIITVEVVEMDTASYSKRLIEK